MSTLTVWKFPTVDGANAALATLAELQKVTEGTSALFLLTSDAVMDRVHAAFEGQQMELIASNLSAEQEAELRATFTED